MGQGVSTLACAISWQLRAEMLECAYRCNKISCVFREALGSLAVASLCFIRSKPSSCSSKLAVGRILGAEGSLETLMEFG